MNIYVTLPEGDVRATFFPEKVRQKLAELGKVTYNETGRNLSGEEMQLALQDQDVVMTGWGTHTIDASVLAGNSRLKVIAHTGGTVANLVCPAVYDKGIRVMSGNLLYAESVAEGTIAYMLTGLRRIPAYITRMTEGGWRTEGELWEGLLDQTVGIVGFGAISKILIQMLKTFRTKIKIYSAYPIDPDFLRVNNAVQTSLEDVFATCKVISIHSALNEKNRYLIGKDCFQLIQNGALFINTSRGDVLQEEALIAALQENRFWAVLDVYADEPPEKTNPLRAMPNVYCIPHMAGPTMDRRERITSALIEEIPDALAGKMVRLAISREYAARMTKH